MTMLTLNPPPQPSLQIWRTTLPTQLFTHSPAATHPSIFSAPISYPTASLVWSVTSLAQTPTFLNDDEALGECVRRRRGEGREGGNRGEGAPSAPRNR